MDMGPQAYGRSAARPAVPTIRTDMRNPNAMPAPTPPLKSHQPGATYVASPTSASPISPGPASAPQYVFDRRAQPMDSARSVQVAQVPRSGSLPVALQPSAAPLGPQPRPLVPVASGAGFSAQPPAPRPSMPDPRRTGTAPAAPIPRANANAAHVPNSPSAPQVSPITPVSPPMTSPVHERLTAMQTTIPEPLSKQSSPRPSVSSSTSRQGYSTAAGGTGNSPMPIDLADSAAEEGPLLDHSHLRPGEHVSLLPHGETLQMYRENAKKTNDPYLNYELAVFMLDVARSLESADPDSDAGNERRELIREAVSNLKKLADRGHADSQYLVADCLVNGFGTLKGKPDLSTAFSFFVLASKHGHPDAGYRAGTCYEKGWGCRRDSAKAVQFYRKAASLGHPGAQYRLGTAELNGELGLKRSARAGVKFLKRSAECATPEFPHALHELALLHEKGIHNVLFADHDHSCELLAQAAEMGYAPSAYKLGVNYEYGRFGCPMDSGLSIHMYNIAAQQNHKEACFALAAWYLVGAPGILPQSDTEAFLWSKRAAEQGMAKAEYTCGYFTENGIGTVRDLAAAKGWYLRAAEHGDSRAQNRVSALSGHAAKQVTDAVPMSEDEFVPVKPLSAPFPGSVSAGNPTSYMPKYPTPKTMRQTQASQRDLHYNTLIAAVNGRERQRIREALGLPTRNMPPPPPTSQGPLGPINPGPTSMRVAMAAAEEQAAREREVQARIDAERAEQERIENERLEAQRRQEEEEQQRQEEQRLREEGEHATNPEMAAPSQPPESQPPSKNAQKGQASSQFASIAGFFRNAFHTNRSSAQRQGRDKQPPPQPEGHDNQPPPQPEGHDNQPPPQSQGHDNQPPPQPQGHDNRPPPQPEGQANRPPPQPEGQANRPPPQPEGASVHDTMPPHLQARPRPVMPPHLAGPRDAAQPSGYQPGKPPQPLGSDVRPPGTMQYLRTGNVPGRPPVANGPPGNAIAGPLVPGAVNAPRPIPAGAPPRPLGPQRPGQPGQANHFAVSPRGAGELGFRPPRPPQAGAHPITRPAGPPGTHGPPGAPAARPPPQLVPGQPVTRPALAGFNSAQSAPRLPPPNFGSPSLFDDAGAEFPKLDKQRVPIVNKAGAGPLGPTLGPAPAPAPPGPAPLLPGQAPAGSNKTSTDSAPARNSEDGKGRRKLFGIL